MKRGQLPLPSLPAWCAFNNVTFAGVSAAELEGRGLGLVAEKDLTDDGSEPALLTIPKDLVVSAEGIEEYAKENIEFRKLLDAAGHKSQRGDVLLFLLTHLILSSPDYKGGRGPATAWTQYFKLLPAQVPVPTLWSESELSLLQGTSLEPAVRAKLEALSTEFNRMRDATEDLPGWNELLSDDEVVSHRDWALLDALYRSRSLALPKAGESMVPCLDLVNHSTSPTAYFDENSKDEAVLRLRDGVKVSKQAEITINYGQDKSAAEMLFSYGFIDSDSTAKNIVLPVETMDDDPLAKAKLHVYGSAPTLKITDRDNGTLQWEAPFIQLMCLNHEDGLHFKVLRETDGSQHLRMFWQDDDVTEEAGNMENLIAGHKYCAVFRLRVLVTVSGMIQQRLESLAANDDMESSSAQDMRPEIVLVAAKLRTLEKDLFERTFQLVQHEIARLSEDDSVQAYFAEINDAQQEDSEDEDFA